MRKPTRQSAEYHSIHSWLAYNYVKPDKCKQCGAKGIKAKHFNIQWALIHGKQHERNIDSYIPLCASCHGTYDYGDFCVNGHLFSPENTMYYKKTQRKCRTCHRKHWREWSKRNPGKNALRQKLKSIEELRESL